MNDQAIRFRFGVFILASLILLAVLIILFGGFPNYFKRTDDYTIIFNNAQGLAPGTPVRRSGVRIGEVRSLALDDLTGKVSVEVRIDDKYRIRKGDRPTLIQGLLGGDSAIAFLPPDDAKLEDPTQVEPGSVLVGVTPADAGALVQKTADLVQPARETVLEMKKVFESVNKMTPEVEKTFKSINEMTPVVRETLLSFREVSKMTQKVAPDLEKASQEIQATARVWGKVGERTDVLLKVNEEKITRSIEQAEETLKRLSNVFSDQNQKYINETLKNVRNGSQQLDSIAKGTGDLIKDTRGTIKQLNDTLKRADDAVADLQKVMKPFGEKGPNILKNVDESAESLNRAMKDVRELVQVFGRSDGTIQKLISDPALYNNLNDTAIMVTKILPRVDRIMRDMETFADKLARHPEVLGLRGAIVPSVGLKESPSVIPYKVLP